MKATQASTGEGPLQGVRIVEFASIGPGPFAGMLLADMGAELVCVQRPGTPAREPQDIIGRGRRAVVHLDLKQPVDQARALRLLSGAHALIEGFRPGVMERLGLSPEAVAAVNPGLVYGRMTGWGQEGPMAARAGHDLNYISLSGALAAIGTPAAGPVPPLNLVGDYGGGALYLVVGVLAALLEARGSGRGQVVDAAMCDGVASLMSLFHSFAALGQQVPRRQANLLDGGAPYYGVYRCSDDGFLAVGSIEPQFQATLCERLGLPHGFFGAADDRASWPALRDRLAAVFAEKPRSHWEALFEGTDACVTPVLSLDEAPRNAHLRARGTYVERDGIVQPAPAPRFSRSVAPVSSAAVVASVDEVLAGWAGA